MSQASTLHVAREPGIADFVRFSVGSAATLILDQREASAADVALVYANEGEPGTIMEAFKPGTGPADTFSVIGGLDQYVPPEEILKNSPQANQAVTSGSNGLF